MINKLYKLLEKDEAVVSLAFKDKQTIISNPNTTEAVLIASSFLINPTKLVLVVNSLYNATRLYDRLNDLLENENIFLFPSDESFELESLSTNKEFIYQRIDVLNKISKLDKYILIVHCASLIRYLPSKQQFNKTYFSLNKGQIINPSDIIKKLIEGGYEYYSHINGPLQYSSRGGVIDIYSINNINPIRIEFFDNEIDSIREFDINTQRTLKVIDSVDIISATDLIYDNNRIDLLTDDLKSKIYSLLDKEIINKEIELLNINPPYYLIYKYYPFLNPSYTSLLDYLDDCKFILIDIKGIYDNFNLIVNDNANKKQLYFNIYDLIHRIKNFNYIDRVNNNSKGIEFKSLEVPCLNGNYKAFDALLRQYILENYKIVICIDNKNQFDCINQYCIESNITISELDKNIKTDVYYIFKNIKEGFELKPYKVIYISSYEIFGVKNRSSKFYIKYKQSIELNNLDSLLIGDYVVSEEYGIGQYLGIETIETDGIHKDYLSIKYAKNASVCIPVEHFKTIRKYVGRDGIEPKLSTLGSKEWSKTKEKIKNRIEELTKELMSLYLARTNEIGYAFPIDEEYQKEFEQAFPYQLTSDQQTCLDEIKSDMEKPLPMDRLLCGDVGFGKTELAFRAAFKAIVSHKQVAFLAPTTLLALQHYKVALDRFKNFPVSIRLVSRLVSNKRLNIIFKEVKEGKVDLLIGTHKLLNKNIVYKDLGLLIIDEEQRFGVLHKETIKKIKNGIDVLTLSATPIPRTMQSSLVGIKSLSQISTPIENRLSVQTYVLERNLNLAKEIIQRELSRDGQIFYIHNNIDNIYELEKQLLDLIPSLKIAVIHGRMNKNDIENQMEEFVNGNIDLLLSTTIVENGIDIPNANTIIIDDAQNFGLSQLYQLKGRVGRSEKIGYCYLFYSTNNQLSETASKRLKAIKEFSELGSGYKIALRDLTIRGAGDLLGKEQAGFIDSLGIDMYLNMLESAIEQNKNPNSTDTSTINKTFKIDAYIPQKFTNDDIDKINIYKKISSIKSIDKLIDYKKELDDIYGKIPHSVELLLEKRRLELYIIENIIDDVIEKNHEYEIVLTKEISQIKDIGVEIFKIVSNISLDMELTYKENKIRVIISKNDKYWLEHANKLLKELNKLFNS